MSCDSQNLRNLPIQRSETLGYQRWAIVYEKKHYENANGVFNSFLQSSGKLGFQVEEPSWIELSRIDDISGFEDSLCQLI
jgi:hypothetical protein